MSTLLFRLAMFRCHALCKIFRFAIRVGLTVGKSEQGIFFRGGSRRYWSMKIIIFWNLVCQHYQMRPEAMSAAGRRRRPSEARAVVAWLIRRHGDMALAEVAKRFGRDAATISTSVRRLEEKMLELQDTCALRGSDTFIDSESLLNLCAITSTTLHTQ